MDKEKRRPQPAAQGAIVLGMADGRSIRGVCEAERIPVETGLGRTLYAAASGVRRRGGGGADEAPGCCKRLPEVRAAHGETIRVVHTLRPVGVGMAGRDTFDPYRD